MRKKRFNGLIVLQSRLLLKYPAAKGEPPAPWGEARPDGRRQRREVIHGVSTRRGGTSRGLYKSLNLSFWAGDKDECVLENRRRFCQALGVPLNSLTVARQVHGHRIKIVKRDDRGKGSRSLKGAIPATDAMLTNEKHISLLALSADCPLVLCYDPSRKVIGLIHASWRGASEGIIRKTILRMQEAFGSKSAEIIAAISPAIGPCCYEVKEDFIDVMTARLPKAQDFISHRRNKTYFDLWAFTRDQLKRSGLRAEHIECADLCTRCHSGLFYSWRREGTRTGRFGALISLSR